MQGENFDSLLASDELRRGGLMNDQIAVVTGGAQGIGLAVAHLLAEQGARVASWDIDPGNGVAMSGLGEGTLAIECDITDLASVEAAYARTCDLLGTPSIRAAVVPNCRKRHRQTKDLPISPAICPSKGCNVQQPRCPRHFPPA